MRILNENLRSQKKRITRFAKKATECFENGQGTLINILAGIKDKHALAEDIVRQQAEVEGCLDSLQSTASQHARQCNRAPLSSLRSFWREL
uniref:Uncharacterized protein n=1 Tax=Caenorhabditis japonica TaxID=281687 RepID=A0A8R1EQI9_CAEJA